MRPPSGKDLSAWWDRDVWGHRSRRRPPPEPGDGIGAIGRQQMRQAVHAVGEAIDELGLRG